MMSQPASEVVVSWPRLMMMSEIFWEKRTSFPARQWQWQWRWKRTRFICLLWSHAGWNEWKLCCAAEACSLHTRLRVWSWNIVIDLLWIFISSSIRKKLAISLFLSCFSLSVLCIHLSACFALRRLQNTSLLFASTKRLQFGKQDGRGEKQRPLLSSSIISEHKRSYNCSRPKVCREMWGRMLWSCSRDPENGPPFSRPRPRPM